MSPTECFVLLCLLVVPMQIVYSNKNATTFTHQESECDKSYTNIQMKHSYREAAYEIRSNRRVTRHRRSDDK